MNLYKYLYRPLANCYSLIKFLLKSERIIWQHLISTAVNSKIHEDAKVWDCYHMTDTIVGQGTYIAPNAMISATTIGKFCSIGPNLCSGWGIHPIDGISTSPLFYASKTPLGYSYSKNDNFQERKPIHIGNDVFIGSNVTILDGVNIGHGAVIGAGAVVSKNIPPYAVAVGSPIRIIRYRFPEDKIQALLEVEWWNFGEQFLPFVSEHFLDIDQFLNTHSTYQTEKNQ